jgi:GGDEF domain-containing protein
MIIDASDADSSEIVAAKVLSELHRKFDLNGHAIQISASIGLSLYPRDSSDLSSLLHCADVAMYRAKSLGGNTFCTYQDARSAQEKLCPPA